MNAGNVVAAEVPNDCNAIIGTLDGTPTGKIKIKQIVASRAGNACNVTFPESVGLCAIALGTLEGSQFGNRGGGETTYRKLSDKVVQVSRTDSGGANPTPGFFSIAAIRPVA